MIRGSRTFAGDITVCTAIGRLTFPEIRDKVNDLSAGGLSSRVLCDLTKATFADLTSAEIEDVIRLISFHIVGAVGSKAAIIAHGCIDYGLARMFSTFAELASLPVKVRVFKTTEVANQWLSDPGAM